MDCVKNKTEKTSQELSNTEQAAVRKSSVLFAESESSAVGATGINRIKLQQKRVKGSILKKKEVRDHPPTPSPQPTT